MRHPPARYACCKHAPMLQLPGPGAPGGLGVTPPPPPPPCLACESHAQLKAVGAAAEEAGQCRGLRASAGDCGPVPGIALRL